MHLVHMPPALALGLAVRCSSMFRGAGDVLVKQGLCALLLLLWHLLLLPMLFRCLLPVLTVLTLLSWQLLLLSLLLLLLLICHLLLFILHLLLSIFHLLLLLLLTLFFLTHDNWLYGSCCCFCCCCRCGCCA